MTKKSGQARHEFVLSGQPNRRLWKVIGMNAGKQKGYDNKNKTATTRKRNSPYQIMLETIENSFRKSKVECGFKAGFFFIPCQL